MSDPVGFRICSHAYSVDKQSPATGGHDHDRNSVPECPFCFVAAQSTGNIATVNDVSALPDDADLFVSAVSSEIGDNAVIPEFHRTGGEARAPPQFSL
jgi:hypothetical protein